MRPHAERRVHDRLLLDAVAGATPVAVSDEEFERALAVLARVQKTTTPALRRALDENGRLALLRDQMRRDKTIRYLLGETTLGETDAGEPDGAGALQVAAETPEPDAARPESA
jgi:FKBP-type peptidyl-prolyl cis-trans isomerase (trigger factor)